jgi:hypothetical protein
MKNVLSETGNKIVDIITTFNQNKTKQQQKTQKDDKGISYTA